MTGRLWPIVIPRPSNTPKVNSNEVHIFFAERHRLPRLKLLDLDIQRLDAVGDLARGHAEDAGGLGLNPAGLLQRGDDALLFREVGVVDIDDFGICP